MSPHWLLGFVEGEGTFGIKGLSPYFQVGQHVRSLPVLASIRMFFGSLPNWVNLSLNSKVPVSTQSLNNRTDVVTYSIQDIDSLYDYVLFFFLGMPFQTRKFIDFQY